MNYPDGPWDIGDEVYVLADNCLAFICELHYYPTNPVQWGYLLRQNNVQREGGKLNKMAWYAPEELR